LSQRDKLKIQGMLKIQRKLTGTFARNTSLRTDNAFPAGRKGSNDKTTKLNWKTVINILIYDFIQSTTMLKKYKLMRERDQTFSNALFEFMGLFT